MREQQKLHTNQSGLVSLVVTMIIMIVLSLIVVGFAQIARREQRTTLDYQLSEQATYAAESGINDAKRAIYDDANVLPGNIYNKANGSQNKDDCRPVAGTPLASNTLSSSVSYSCLLIDQSLPELKYGNIRTDGSTVIPINAVIPGTDNPRNLDRLVINWQISGVAPSGPGSSYPSLPAAASWGATRTGILRTDILNPGNFSRSAMTNSLFTTFMYPGSGTGSTTYQPNSSSPAAQGELTLASCSGPFAASGGLPAMPYQCRVVIDLPNNSPNYYLRLRSIYNASQVEIVGIGVGGSVELKGAQVEIDSTGRAADVLKRVKVRSKAPDNTTQKLFPEYALDISGGICKQLVVTPVPGTSKDNCPTAAGPPVLN